MRSKPMILAALLLAAFLVNLDTTMVNVALPAMVRQLHATTTQLQWVVDAYNLVFAALLLTFGSLSDRFGRKGMLLAGLAVVGAASLAGGFTTSPAQLIAARAVMGLGAAMTFPATLSLISNVFTERRERARAIGRPRVQNPYLSLTNYVSNLRKLGWTDADLADGGSDALIDALAVHGDAAAIGRGVTAHLEAGADHVAAQVLNRDPLPALRALAGQLQLTLLLAPSWQSQFGLRWLVPAAREARAASAPWPWPATSPPSRCSSTTSWRRRSTRRSARSRISLTRCGSRS